MSSKLNKNIHTILNHDKMDSLKCMSWVMHCATVGGLRGVQDLARSGV